MNKYKQCFIIFEMQKYYQQRKKSTNYLPSNEQKQNINGLEYGAIGKTHKKIRSRPC